MDQRSLYDRLIYPTSETEQNAAADEAWAEIEQLRKAVGEIRTALDEGTATEDGMFYTLGRVREALELLSPSAEPAP